MLIMVDLLSYLNFPALIIDGTGHVINRSKSIELQYKINEGDDFFSYCNENYYLAKFFLNLSNLPLGSNDKCLTRLNFSNIPIDVSMTVINKKPIRILIEFNVELYPAFGEELFFKDLLNNSSDLLSLIDKDYRYVSVNKQYSLHWKLPHDEIINCHVSTVIGDEVFNRVVKKELDLCFAGKIRTYTDWFYSEKTKQMFFLKVVYHPVIEGDSGKVKSVAETVTDITDIYANYEVLSHKAFHDSLTKLNNRHALLDYFSKINSTLTRDHSYCLIMIDLDEFKQINDKNGHVFADELLILFSNELKSTLRQDDFCCRWGGDEFILLLAEKHPVQHNLSRQNITTRLSQLKNKVYVIQNKKIPLSFTLGLSFFPEQGHKLQDLIDIADNDMYKGKMIKRLKRLKSTKV